MRRRSRRAGAAAVVAGAPAEMPHIVTEWRSSCRLRSVWTADIGVSLVVPVAPSSSSRKGNCSVRGAVPAVKSDGRRWRSLQRATTSKKSNKIWTALLQSAVARGVLTPKRDSKLSIGRVSGGSWALRACALASPVSVTSSDARYKRTPAFTVVSTRGLGGWRWWRRCRPASPNLRSPGRWAACHP